MHLRIRSLLACALLAVCAESQNSLDDDQRRALQAATEFARSYVGQLPDFTCIRTTQHSVASAAKQDWRVEAKVADELTYLNHRLSDRVIAVNGVPKNKVSMWTMAAGWFEAPGTFDSMIGDIFDPAAHADFEWHGWDFIRGSRAYVFSYAVNQANTKAVAGVCRNWIAFTSCKQVKYAYHGLIYIDAGSLDILRLTYIQDGIPANQLSAAITIDYGRITVTGKQYLLPVSDYTQAASGKMLLRNESTFDSYKKFVAESTLTVGPPSGPEAATNPPTPPSAAISAEPPGLSDCFQLRDKGGKTAPAIMRASLAASFNDFVQATKELLAIVRSHPDSDEAYEAHAELLWMNQLSGHAQEALDHEQALRKDAADGPPGLLQALANYPDQSIEIRAYSRIPFVHKDGDFSIAASIADKSAQFVLDSGAAISSISESQAAALGLPIHEEEFSMTDASGKNIACRLGIANELAIGNFRLKNVPFCVQAADSSLLGLPVLLAFETLRLNRGGDLEIGFPSARKNIAQSNICFDGGSLAVQIGFKKQALPFAFDTGNGHTFLYPEFTGLADSAKASSKDTYVMTALGGATELKASELPQLTLTLDGLAATLSNVVLLADSVSSDCPGCYGNAGTDLLDRATTITLDFKAMRLILRP